MPRTAWLFLGLLAFSASASPQGLSDVAVRAELHEKGVRVQTGRATVYFDREELTPPQHKEFVQLADRGIRDIQSFLKLRPRQGKIRYYVSARVRISHSSDSDVFLPLYRVAERTAPYLHETAHVLAPVKSESLWLSEGFASYVESQVTEQYGGYPGRIFNRGGNAEIDQEAVEHLARENGKAVAPYVGAQGMPHGLFWNREAIAAPFYVLAQSFVKFLVEKMGLQQVMALTLAADAMTGLIEITGKSSEVWRTEWMDSLALK